MRIEQIRLQNFKSVAAATVDLSPLTVVLGANSSGKSTLMQALLILTQGLRSGIDGPTFPISGDLFRPGGFADVRSAFAPDGDMCFGLSVVTERSRGPRRTIDHTRFQWDVRLRGQAPNEPGSSTIQEVDFRAGSAEQTQLSYRTQHVEQPKQLVEFDADTRLELFAGRLPGVYVPSADAKPIETVSTALVSGLPRGARVERREGQVLAETWVDTVVDWWQTIEIPDDGVEIDAEVIEPETLEDMIAEWVSWAIADIHKFQGSGQQQRSRRAFQNFLLDRLDDLEGEELDPLPAALFAMHRPRLTRAIEERLGLTSTVAVHLDDLMLRRLHFATQQFAGLFEMLSWLGPIRLEPQPVYPTSPTARTGAIGTRGEHMAAVFRAFRHEQVSYVRPDGRSNRATLETAVVEWARHLGLIELVTAEDLPRLGLDVRVEPVGLSAQLDLTAVGVGVSQLLPVLVLCLHAPRGSVILLEQPELHLHPAVQLDLADFLFAMVKGGRQIIVETHSEHLVQRLRRKIAEAGPEQDQQLIDEIAFVFAERDRNGVTTYRNVRANRFGGLQDWPQGFFADGADEAKELIAAGLRKRAAEQN